MFDLLTLAVEDLGTAGNLEKYAGNVTLSGLIIVFTMLVLLVLLIAVFGMIMVGASGRPKKEVADKPVKPVKPIKSEKPAKTQKSPKNAVVTDINSTNDEKEIVAAISAAVAMMYEGTGIVPAIRSIRPAVVGARSAWKAAGIANNTRSF